MKKLFAIFASFCLFAAANVFADTWNSGTNANGDGSTGSGQGQFTAGVICTPSFGITTTGNGLGNFFNDGTSSINASEHTMVGTLKGPNTTDVTYTFTVAWNGFTVPSTPIPGSSLLANAINQYLTANVNTDFKLYADGESATNGGVYLTGSFVAAGTMDCTTALSLTFAPTSITVPSTHAPSTALTFTVTVTVEAESL